MAHEVTDQYAPTLFRSPRGCLSYLVGHDYKGRTSSTLKDERETNPRLQLSREEFMRELNAHHPPKPELFENAMQANSE